jgi:hypothetical protein
MRFFDHLPRRDYEEALRSLGRLLDDDRLEDILVMELAEGFMVTGLRPTEQLAQDTATGADRPRSYEHGEAMFFDPDVDAASKQGQTFRGTGREAGRYEQALRLIGRQVNTDQGALVLVMDQGDSFMLRMVTKSARDLPYRYAAFRTGELDRIRDQAHAARTGTEAPAFPAREATAGRGKARAKKSTAKAT